MRLTKEQLGPDPVAALRRWFDDARDAGLGEEHVVTLATVDPTGAPDARLVVVRAIDQDGGLTYYADTRSPKSRHLAADPRAAMVGHWPQLSRQVRLRGEVSVLPGPVSDQAFAARTRQSQIGYWANDQSEPIRDRAALEQQLDAVIARFEHTELTRPEHWVVYRLLPRQIEFWQSGERHLHDRIAYTADESGGWTVDRLQP